jgi:dipeptidyl-peptidase-3
MAEISVKTKASLDRMIGPLLAVPPFSLGYTSKNAQSGYYPSDQPLTQDEIDKVSEAMNKESIGPENTRVRKVIMDGKPVFQLLQASAESDPPEDSYRELIEGVVLVRGDHSEELAKVCSALEKAKMYAGNDKQTRFLDHYIECFRTGSLEAFQESQKVWVTDVSARVENILGFIEPYRDLAGIRSEWEAMIGIADADEIKKPKLFVDSSSTFIRQLPWAVENVNDGKGLFEKSLFEARDFTSVHGQSFLQSKGHADLSSACCVW